MAWTSEYLAQDTSDSSLEHFGVRGMHWGVRKSRPTGSSNGNSERKSSFKRKSRVALGVAATVGAVAVGTMIKRSQNEKLARKAVADNIDYLSKMVPPNWKVR